MKEEEMNALDRDYQEKVELERIKVGMVGQEEIDLESLPKNIHTLKRVLGDERPIEAIFAEYVLSGLGNATSLAACRT